MNAQRRTDGYASLEDRNREIAASVLRMLEAILCKLMSARVRAGRSNTARLLCTRRIAIEQTWCRDGADREYEVPLVAEREVALRIGEDRCGQHPVHVHRAIN